MLTMRSGQPKLVAVVSILALAIAWYTKWRVVVKPPENVKIVPSTFQRSRPDVRILFATATGTAETLATALEKDIVERLAGQLSGTAANLDCTSSVRCGDCQSFLEDVESELQQFSAAAVRPEHSGDVQIVLGREKLVVFFLATTGEGECPDDGSRKLLQLLKECRDATNLLAPNEHLPLKGLKFAIFSLGDTAYRYYCQVGKSFDDLLSTLGAVRMIDTAFSDARQGGSAIDDLFLDWTERLLEVGFGLSEDDDDRLSKPPPSTLRCVVVQPLSSTTCTHLYQRHTLLPFMPPATHIEPSHKHPLFVPISSVETIARAGVLKIVVDLSTSPCVAYQAGDHLGVMPVNDEAVVARYLKLLRVEEDRWWDDVEVLGVAPNRAARANDEVNILPSRISLFRALAHYVDLSGVPKKSCLLAISRCCASEVERRAFVAVVKSPEGFAGMDLKLENLVRVADFLQAFPSCVVPLHIFFQYMPRIQPRFFSIASDQLVSSRQISIVVKLEEGGLASSFLTRGTRAREEEYFLKNIAVFVRKSTFHLPLRQKTRPVLFIGPGTGVAPFIGMLHRRSAWKAKQPTLALGKCYLMFGCRRESEDYIVRDDLQSFLQMGILSKLFVAFSRDDEALVNTASDSAVNIRRMQYVQAYFQESPEIFLEFFHGGSVYICGNAARMAKDVEQAIIESVLCGAGKMSRTHAVDHLQSMAQQGHYLKDIW